MSRLLVATALVLSCAAPALGQARAGLYHVAGTEAGRGAFTGTVELRWTGTDYDLTRQVEFTTFTHQGRPVSTAWSGRARDVAGGGLEADVALERMGWIAEAPGLAPRTAADGVPMLVRGVFSGAPLSGRWTGQGSPFADPSETWTLTGVAGPRPAWESLRGIAAGHRPPTAGERSLIMSVFGSFHAVPWVAPFVPRPEFQAAQYSARYDWTDMDLHRRRPDLLRVVQRLVDPLALEEARVKANAYGRALRTKAEAADLEVEQRFVDASGALHLRLGGAPEHDNDGCLWTGVYAFTQAVRADVTGDPAALAGVERTARALHLHMAITGRPDEFARTLRAAQGPGGPWHAGTGPHAHLEWKEGGNNDMFKGLILGAVAAGEALGGPRHAPFRAEYAASLTAFATHHPVARGTWFKTGNPVMVRGAIAVLDGASASRDAYRSKARNPLHLLYTMAAGGGLTYLGQADWSGTHLDLTSLLAQQRMAARLSEPLHRRAVDTALRRSALRLAPLRRSLHALAAAAYAGLPHGEAQDGVQALKELPFPRAEGYGVRPTLRADWCPGPWPNLPWKLDWTTNRGRTRGMVMPPLFEQDHGNYLWKNVPYEGPDGSGPSGWTHHSTDYLVAYWLARKAGVIGPTD